MRTLDEYAATRAQRPNQIDHRAELVRGLRMMAQESVRAEALTGDPAWDGFLAYLEAFIAAAKRSLESELAKVRDPLTGEEEVRRSSSGYSHRDLGANHRFPGTFEARRRAGRQDAGSRSGRVRFGGRKSTTCRKCLTLRFQ